jgi:ribonuclease G
LSEEILINITPTESRVALVEDGMLQEVWLERDSRDGYLGRIYMGRVSRVLPGMQAAFVDIGLERTAFLHASDLARPGTEWSVGQESAGPPPQAPPIQEQLREQSEVVVQVIRDPIGSKGARLTTQLSIASRFLVLLPGADGVGVSVRIEDAAERERLVTLVNGLRDPAVAEAYIVRTNAEGADADALRADMRYLRTVWQEIQHRRDAAAAGACLYAEPSLPLRVLRDLVRESVERVRIDHAETCEAALDFMQRFVPQWAGHIEYYSADRPLFDLHGIEDEINQALRRKSPLKSGGYLVIDQTEAMTTIDVNTGAFVGSRTQEDTVYQTNLEAAQAIGRQLRLRNLGGIIIIDFIDMADEQHQGQVLRTLEAALERDHARTRVFGFSPLGLVEMTRKRTTGSLGQVLCQPCPLCSGRGHIKGRETVCQEVIREIMRSGRQFEANKLLVMASPAVVDHMLDEHSTTIAGLEESGGRVINFQREEQYMQEQFDVVLL